MNQKKTIPLQMRVQILFWTFSCWMSCSPAFAQDAVLVKDINPGASTSTPGSFTHVNGTLYFSASEGTHGRELWKSDGTTAGTVMVKDIWPGANGGNPNFFATLNDTLYFLASDGTHGPELWKSDGTTAGTIMVKDINPGATYNGFHTPAYLTNVNDTLYFQASDSTHGRELWKSDGTTAGTVMVKDINPGPNGSGPDHFTNLNGILYFTANDGTHGGELWRSDGTTAGTVMVKDIRSGSNSTYPYALMNVNSILYFRADDGTHGLELWRSDGTTAGTVMVKDIWSGSNGSWPAYLTSVNDTLYFFANYGTNWKGLWKSDGTAAGTVLVKDINSGAAGSNSYVTNANGTLYFLVNDGTQKLWKSDGTTAGTVMVKDIWPGGNYINSGAPSDLTQVNNALYFRANDGTHGIELWKIGQNQAITFDSLANQSNDQVPFDLVATANSGLPVSFSVVSGPATISGHTLTLSGDPGTIIVRASQEGNLTYNATSLERSFNVTADTTHSLLSGCQSGRLVSTREEETLPEVHVFSVGQTIHARFTHLQVKEVETTVFNRLGQVVDWFSRQRVEAQQMSISSRARQGDIYVVRFVTDQGTFVKKLYLSPQ